MIDPEVLGVIAWLTIPIAILFTLFAGINRIPWWQGLQIGVGCAAILALASYAGHAPVSQDVGHLVLIGAGFGGLVIRAYDRGMAQRRAEIDRILAIPGSPQT